MSEVEGVAVTGHSLSSFLRTVNSVILRSCEAANAISCWYRDFNLLVNKWMQQSRYPVLNTLLIGAIFIFDWVRCV